MGQDLLLNFNGGGNKILLIFDENINIFRFVLVDWRDQMNQDFFV